MLQHRKKRDVFLTKSGELSLCFNLWRKSEYFLSRSCKDLSFIFQPFLSGWMAKNSNMAKNSKVIWAKTTPKMQHRWHQTSLNFFSSPPKSQQSQPLKMILPTRGISSDSYYGNASLVGWNTALTLFQTLST